MLYAAATIAIAFAISAPPDEIRYGDATLSQWRTRLADFDAESPRAAAWVPAIVEILTDERVDTVTRRAAALALGRIGSPARPAVPTLIAMIADRREDHAEAAAWATKAVSLMGPHAREATPELAKAADDDRCDFAVRQLSLEALARIGGAHADAMPAIVRVVQRSPSAAANAQQQAELRLLAIEALGVAKGDGAIAAPLLARILQSPREGETIRLRSAEALAAMGPAAHIARETLFETLVVDESQAVRDSAAKALAAMGESTAPLLTQALKHPDEGVRWRAAQALGTMGDAARSSVTALLTAATNQREAEIVRLHASHAVWLLRPTAESAAQITPTLLMLLTSSDRNIRFRSLDVFNLLGDARQRAVPQLEKLTRHERREVRQIAQQALRDLQTPSQ